MGKRNAKIHRNTTEKAACNVAGLALIGDDEISVTECDVNFVGE
jgi:hypothetical protein